MPHIIHEYQSEFSYFKFCISQTLLPAEETSHHITTSHVLNFEGLGP